MAKLLGSRLGRMEGALMIRAKKHKALSLFVVVALVISMLPIGALVAFATSGSQTIATPTVAPSINVVAGTATTTVKNQPAGDITVKEDSAYKNEWSVEDTTVAVDLPDNVYFSTKPTVKLNGATLNTSLTNGANTLTFTVSGSSDVQDIIEITGIKYDLGPASESEVAVTITDPDADKTVANVTVKNAKIKGGLIGEAVGTVPTDIKTGENGQVVADLQISESQTGIAKADSKITIAAPAGITFFEPPALKSEAKIDIKESYGTLSDDRTKATFTVGTATSGSDKGVFVVSSKINVASTFAADTDIKFTISSSDTGVAIAPSDGVKVAKTSAGDALTITAVSAPNVAKSANQAVGDISIVENKKEALKAGDTDGILTIEIVDGTSTATFASTPKATPSGGLKLKDAEGNAVATAVAGSLSANNTKATWTITDQSTATNGGSIIISGISLNVNKSSGQIKIKVSGAATGNVNKEVVVANISTAANVTVTAAGTPVLKINTANQTAGDIIITESKAGALSTADIHLKIFGVSSDKEILFAELPTVSVTAGDINLGTVAFGSDNTEVVIPVDAISTKASTIKISGIKYDISSKAVEGSIQIIVLDGTTRLASVANATISKTGLTFSDVPESHWAKTFIDFLAAKGIIGGYTDGTFKPAGIITRAEFAKIAVVAGNYSLSTTTTASFSDVSTSHWAFKYIETAKANGIIGGYSDGTFRPNAPITRAELAKMVVLAGKLNIDKSGTAFPDVASDHWAFDYIMTAKNNNIIGGYPDGTFKPSGNANRAEASKMVYEWLN